MKTTPWRIDRLVSGGVIPGYLCPCACRHCLYRCGPWREEGFLESGPAEELFGRVRALGCPSLHIGGGEPLLRPSGVEALLAAARRAGVGIDYLETNAAWFRDEPSAVELFSALRRRGLRAILVSISPFHNEFIPFRKTRGAIAAAERAGLGVIPWVADFIPELEALGADRPHGLAEFAARFGEDYLERVPGRYWIHPGGRALDTFRPVLGRKGTADVLEESPPSCARELGDTRHFHIDLHGNYIPGLCAGLAIAATNLGTPLDPDRYPLIATLASAGIRGLFAFARREAGFSPAHERWWNRCDLCEAIRRFLFERGWDRSRELAPKEFYRRRSPSCETPSRSS